MIENRPGVDVGNRRGRNPGHLRRLFGRSALRVWKRRRGRNPWRGGIAGKLEHVSDRSALHTSIGSPRSLGILVPTFPTIVSRVGVNDDAGGAVLLSNE